MIVIVLIGMLLLHGAFMVQSDGLKSIHMVNPKLALATVITLSFSLLIGSEFFLAYILSAVASYYAYKQWGSEWQKN